MDNADVVHDLEILIEEKVDHIGGFIIILGRCTPVSETGIHIFKELFDEIKEHGFIHRKCSAFIKICTDLACNFRFTAAENRIRGIIKSQLTVAGLAGDKFGGEVIFIIGSAPEEIHRLFHGSYAQLVCICTDRCKGRFEFAAKGRSSKPVTAMSLPMWIPLSLRTV